jgi:hypothetical protein
MKHLLTCLLLLCPIAAAAQSPSPASVSDCERLKNDLAYNQCLASFGPKRGERAARDGDGDQVAVEPAPGGRTRAARGGRQAASFDVVSGRAARRSSGAASRQR